MLLRLDDVRRHFGGVHAVDGVSLEVEQGTIQGLIGPNGAGKTTLVNVITGYVRFQSGRAWLESDELTGLPAHRIASLGVARTFQNIRLFKDLTAIENVLIGMHTRLSDDTVAQLATLPFFRRSERERVKDANALLETVGLARSVGARQAGTLPYGDQRRLEIARALALRPRLLILDEPAAGMNPSEKQGVRELIERLNAGGLTILLIDHDMRLVMGVCKRVAVLNFGKKIADGTPQEVSTDASVIKAYLGTGGEREVTSAPGASGVDEETEVEEAAVSARSAHEPQKPILDVQDLTVSYGAVVAVRGASFRVGAGEVVALIGANGAGKSTILNTLSGLIRAQSGVAVFDGLDLTAAKASAIVRRGLIQVPEGREILARQTVLENLELATWARRDGAAARKRIDEVLKRFPILGERRDLSAGSLSGGEQQMLAIARGVLARPRLLLLDEPSLGLAPQMVDEVFRVIDEIHKEGTTILLVEQNALRALAIADRAYVIETGRILLSGSGDDLLHNPAVRRAYLGG
ncbi:MAG TPA: ATP-binding cassette domain-containing protein [Candidatus Dormibacteraeota bacterium]|nr:ATP-binding cassette domain-containing protein [Candidatus Dormibacteraeota bacterium]